MIEGFDYIDDLETAFAPLLDHAKSLFTEENAVHRFLSDYMYMYSDKTHSFFKNIINREYIKLPR